MDPTLLSWLLVLAAVSVGVMGNLNFYLLARTFGWFAFEPRKDTPIEVKVEAAGPEDNHYTKWAAEAQASGVVEAAKVTAQATTKAAADNLAAALATQRAEEARLERVRLELTASGSEPADPR